MEKPLVSIVVPTYNRCFLLLETLQSIVHQDYNNIEIIISDDNSNDDTKRLVFEFIKQYPNYNIKYFLNRKYFPGPNGNKNNGLDHCTGELITILDDDDLLFPKSISLLVNEYISKKCLMVFGNCVRSDNLKYSGHGLNKSGYIYFKDVLSGKVNGEFFGLNHYSLFRNQRFDHNQYSGESNLWWQFYKYSKAYYIHKPLRFYRIHKNSVSSFFKYPDRSLINFENKILLYKKDYLKYNLKKNLAKDYFYAFIYSTGKPHFKKAVKYFLLSVKYNFFYVFLFFLIGLSFLPNFLIRFLYRLIKKLKLF